MPYPMLFRLKNPKLFNIYGDAMRDELDKLTIPVGNLMSYSDYLKVNQLISLQEPLAKPPQHDEMLFIIIHQVYELWFKQLYHEVQFCIDKMENDNLMLLNKSLRRMVAITNIMVSQVDVIETMTPVEFNTFRTILNPASGFQSYQFRLFEFLMGHKTDRYLRFYQSNREALSLLENQMEKPSFYDYWLRVLQRRGFPVPESILNRDFKRAHKPNKAMTKIIADIYTENNKYFDLYMCMESMLDFDEKFLHWRFRHVTMVERMIGNKMGTGGSSGVNYLTSTLSKKFFEDIWSIRTHLDEGH